ncbi:MAG: MBL fold metallo-hydrolase [Candidatus Thorarchaeota archaeon]
MKATQISERGFVFTFEDPYLTNVLVNAGEERIFVCDTFCGPESMSRVSEYLQQEGYRDLPTIVFNSHSHYDHIWGNSFFNGLPIIGHNDCRRLIEKEGQKALVDYKSHMKGEVVLVTPNITFAKRILFPEDEIEFFHSPGHTIDSASCYDHKDKVLFVSDNVESPLPHICQPDLGLYLETLGGCLDRDWNVLVTGHDPIMKEDGLLRQNLDYLTRLKSWTIQLSKMPPAAHHQHLYNILLLEQMVEGSGLEDSMIMHFDDVINYLSSKETTVHENELLKQLKSVTRKKR